VQVGEGVNGVDGEAGAVGDASAFENNRPTPTGPGAANVRTQRVSGGGGGGRRLGIGIFRRTSRGCTLSVSERTGASFVIGLPRIGRAVGFWILLAVKEARIVSAWR
jgi:hypothetical protein